ncbi:MAG: aspartate dehydrogenase [Eubacteriales bacterium]|nr:aspartate dehydrogenase [Sarcina sp.]MDO4417152.1 aspartate dehydrogenase [Eubacteriales bacterium]
MLFFGKKNKDVSPGQSYDAGTQTPVLRCSICNGEQVAGFQDRETKAFTEVMLIRSSEDLEAFRKRYGITGEIKKIY